MQPITINNKNHFDQVYFILDLTITRLGVVTQMFVENISGQNGNLS